jgi:class 3 adenylate cyclase
LVLSCASCGAANRDSARFCDECGMPFDASPVPERRKLATVLFCDMSGSTALGERLDPETVREMMFEYFHEMRSAIERHGGTVEKFVGDAVMAVFGVPAAREDDALRAVRAASEMRVRVELLNETLERRFSNRIALRIGLNTGEVVAGDATARQSLVTGDAVNVAARLEQGAAPGEVRIGESTYRLVRAAVVAEPLPPVEARGRSEPVRAFRVLEVDVGAPVGRRLDAEIVGRDQELATLRRAFGAALRARRCELTLLAGDAGVGKSRLAEELLHSLVGEATILRGRCLSYGEGITYWPLVEAVRQAARVRDGDSFERSRAKIERLLSSDAEGARVAAIVAQAVGLGDATAGAGELAWAVRRLLETLARERPLVLLLDDLHWGEPALLDLVEGLPGGIREAPVLALCLARPELLRERPTLNQFAIRLDPLDEDESARLIENLLGDAGLDGDARARLVEAAGGNPLFVEELVGMLVDDGLLRHENGRWMSVSDLSHVSIPPTVEALLESRLDRLERSERLAAERGSIEGQVFHLGAVAALRGSDDDADLAATLEQLVALELVRSEPALFAGEAAYKFKHILIHDAAYAGIPKKVRAELHERFSNWLERVAGDRVGEYEEILGYHLEQAVGYRLALAPGDAQVRALAERAAGRLESAGRRAFGRSDFVAAANLLGRAAELLAGNPCARLPLLPDLGAALREAGELAGAENVLSEAVGGAAAFGDARLEARAAVERSLLRLYTDPAAQLDELSSIARAAIPIFEASEDVLGLSKAWSVVAQAKWARCRCKEVEQALERALAYAERAGDPHERAWIAGGLLRASAWGPTRVEPALRRCRELLERAGGDRSVRVVAAAASAYLEAMGGRFAEARRLCATSRAIAEELGLIVWAATLTSFYAPVELLAGDPSAAERLLRRGYETLDAMGERSRLATVAAQLARSLELQGRLDEAESFVGVSERASSRDDIAARVVSQGTRGRVLAQRGELDEALAVAQEAVDAAATTDMVTLQGDALVDLAETLRVTGRIGRRREVLLDALRLYRSKGNVAAARATEAQAESLVWRS